MILLPLLLQVGSTPALNPLDQRYQSCLALATNDPKAAELEAGSFAAAGGGARAMQCHAMAMAQQNRWAEAAAWFEKAADEAITAKDPLASRYRAQAGNAWLASGDAARARVALTTALAGPLSDFDRGEALLDRARASVAAGSPASARADLDSAVAAVPRDPLAWLLSATLARRMKDLPRAKADIEQALTLSSDDPSVQLEAGNIAALSGDATGARAAWQMVVKLAPGTPVGDSARAALAQFDAPPPPAPPPAPAQPPAK